MAHTPTVTEPLASRVGEHSNERWQVIPDAPAYEVSTLGRVRRIDSGNVISTKLKPYCREVRLSRGSEGPIYRAVHVLVANAFGLKRSSGERYSFRNRDRYDCRLSNLAVSPVTPDYPARAFRR
ncbi:NUMOD4 domain-containing protein [Amycolatopsis marina]|nr:NUMOD4 domain-containing protein [Amycolatopsis marina]